jgi:CheY-like chemotaxis protein
MHGGRIGASSDGKGKGATFRFTLPVVDAVGRVGAIDAPSLGPEAAPAGAGVRILVADDNVDAASSVAMMLEIDGYQVEVAHDGRRAIARAAAARPAAMVVDIGMPGADGYELLRRVRELGPSRGGRVPAIALTAFARSEDRTRALRSGFMVHVAKPVDPSELVATVAAVAGRVHQSGEVQPN